MSHIRHSKHTAIPSGKTHPAGKWSAYVTNHSDAMTLAQGVFTRSPAAIARSIKSSAEHSHRRKSSPYRSAMSMLTFYINRTGRNLTPEKRKKLEAAKSALQQLFGKNLTKA